MAFPDGWNRKCKITIDNTKVSSTESNFTVTLTESNIPSECLDADGSYPANSDGGDIRFTTDAAGTTQIARHIVEFTRDNNPALGTAEIKVNVPSISSSADTDIWMWYNNSGASEPAADSTYGSQNAYDASTKAVYTFNEDPSGTNPTQTDPTSNSIDANTYSMESGDLVNADWGKALDFDGSAEYGQQESSYQVGTNPFTFEAYFYPHAVNYYQMILAKDQISFREFLFAIGYPSSGVAYMGIFGGQIVQTPINKVIVNSWNHLVGKRESGGTVSLTINNEKTTGGSDSSNMNKNAVISIARRNYSGYPEYYDGLLSEIIIAETARSDGWITTRFNNLTDIANFASADTPQATGGAEKIYAQLID